MSDINFRSLSADSAPVAPPEAGPDFEPNERGGSVDVGIEEPLEGTQTQDAVLTALGIDDPTGIPSDDSEMLADVTSYLTALIKQRGSVPTASKLSAALADVKFEMGLDQDAEPSIVLNRIGSVIRGYKELSFIKDPAERRRLFMKLARQPDSRSIDRIVMEESERRRIWR